MMTGVIGRCTLTTWDICILDFLGLLLLLVLLLLLLLLLLFICRQWREQVHTASFTASDGCSISSQLGVFCCCSSIYWLRVMTAIGDTSQGTASCVIFVVFTDKVGFNCFGAALCWVCDSSAGAREIRPHSVQLVVSCDCLFSHCQNQRLKRCCDCIHAV